MTNFTRRQALALMGGAAAGSLYDLERLFTGVVMLSMLGVTLSWLIGLVERRVLVWRS